MPGDLAVPSILTVFGAGWCSDCHRTRRFLDGAGVPYQYVDLASEPAAQAMLDAAGYRAIPIVLTPGGQILVEPSDRALAAALDADAA